jgi:hypothetical protein
MSPSAASVSCIVTAYQYGHFIGRCLDSVLAQDHPRELLDVVVVDDGSTDDTAQVVARYGDAVRYIRQDNAGQIAATNRGIAEARGDYLILVDADDTIPADRVSAQAAILDARPEVGLVYGDMSIIDADDRLLSESYHRQESLTPHTGRVLAPLLLENFMPGGTMMFRAADRDVYHPIGAQASVQDWWIGTQLAAVSEVAYVDRPMNRYRLHGANDNLGADQRRKLGLVSNDLRFRRWVLGHLDLSQVAVDDLLAAWVRHDQMLRHVCFGLQDPFERHTPVTDEDAERAQLHLARARIAAARGARERAIRLLIVALAADPLSEPARVELAALAGAGDPGPALGTRGFVTFALADELLADRRLLTAYASAFDGDDDATLVIYAPADQPAVAERLGVLVAEAGLDGPDSPDMLAVFGPTDPAAHPAVPRAVHAVLSERGGPAPIAVPCWGCRDVATLRRYAASCLTL